MRIYLGRHVYGLAAIIFGIVTLGWRDFTTWQQNIPRGLIVVYLVAALELFGGVAIQWPKTARAGAIALAIIYTFLLCRGCHVSSRNRWCTTAGETLSNNCRSFQAL
jgi:hypothetical protein